MLSLVRNVWLSSNFVNWWLWKCGDNNCFFIIFGVRFGFSILGLMCCKNGCVVSCFGFNILIFEVL